MELLAAFAGTQFTIERKKWEFHSTSIPYSYNVMQILNITNAFILIIQHSTMYIHILSGTKHFFERTRRNAFQANAVRKIITRLITKERKFIESTSEAPVKKPIKPFYIS